MAKYFKLGVKASTFHDVSTGVTISNKQVIRIEVDADANRPTLQKARETGHIVDATKEEWEAYKALSSSQARESQKNLKVVTAPAKYKSTPPEEEPEEDEDEDTGLEEEDLTKSDLIDRLKESALISEEDKKKLSKASIETLRTLWEQIKPKS